MHLSAILFDCDGVLVDSEVIYIAVELDMLAQIGLVYDIEDYQSRFLGLSNGDYMRLLKTDCMARTNRDLPDDFERRLDAACRQRLLAELESMEGVEALLDTFTGSIAVASSSAPDLLHAKLHKTGLHARFDPHIYSGEEVSCGKPAPDLFLHAADRIGVAPERCLVIEDSVNGVSAGRAACMKVWGFIGGGHASEGLERQLREAGSEMVFAQFADLQSRLHTEFPPMFNAESRP